MKAVTTGTAVHWMLESMVCDVFMFGGVFGEDGTTKQRQTHSRQGLSLQEKRVFHGVFLGSGNFKPETSYSYLLIYLT